MKKLDDFTLHPVLNLPLNVAVNIFFILLHSGSKRGRSEVGEKQKTNILKSDV